MNETTMITGERAALMAYNENNALMLAHPDYYQPDASKPMSDLYYGIAQSANNLITIHEEDAGIRLAERLLDQVSASEDARSIVWGILADRGSLPAGEKLRTIMGIRSDEAGNTIPGDETDVYSPKAFWQVLSLYKLGDASLLPFLHQYVEDVALQNSRSVLFATKMYEAGDDTAYDLVVATAKRQLAVMLSGNQGDVESKTDVSFDSRTTLEDMLLAVGAPRSEVEMQYAQSDLALVQLARDLLKAGDPQRANEIQSLVLSRYDNAELNAWWFENGYDTEGVRCEATMDYLMVYSKDIGNRSFEITNALVRGGDTELVAQYQSLVYDPEVLDKDFDLPTVIDMLSALHKSGDRRAHDRLVELFDGDEDNYSELMDALDNMGFKDEAMAMARQAFVHEPSYDSASDLLTYEYNADALDVVQSGMPMAEGRVTAVINSRARQLGKLAVRIGEQKTNLS